jgi:hypothetical protein
VGEDPTSPTGLTLLLQNIGGVEDTVQRPYYPPPESPRNPPQLPVGLDGILRADWQSALDRKGEK